LPGIVVPLTPKDISSHADLSTNALVAAYQAIDGVDADFEAVAGKVKDVQIAANRVILSTQDHDGAVTLRQMSESVRRPSAQAEGC
jgi:hypothetical protein